MLTYNSTTKMFELGLYKAMFIDSSTGSEVVITEYTNDRQEIERRVASQPHLYRLSIEQQFAEPIQYTRLGDVNAAACDPAFLPQASDYVQYGYMELFDGAPEHIEQIFNKPEVQSAYKAALINKLKDTVADMRWQREVSGISINNMTFGTTDREKGLLNGKILSTVLNPNQVVQFKVEEGWVTLTAQQIQQVGLLVDQYIQALFAHEGILAHQLENAVDPKTVDIKNGWPVNSFQLDAGE